MQHSPALSDLPSLVWTTRDWWYGIGVLSLQSYWRDAQQVVSLWSQRIRLQTVSQCWWCLLAKQFDQKRKEKSLKCFQVLRKCLGSFFARTTVRVGHSDLASSWCWMCRSLWTEASGEQCLLRGSYRLCFFFHKVLLVIYTCELVKYKPINSWSLWSGTFFSRCYGIFKGLAVKYLSFICS